MKEIGGQIAGLGALLSGGLLAKSGIQDAMRYEALMTTLGETLGESRNQFEDWQKKTGRAMGFSMLQGAELANMLSLNFKSISKDTADLTKKTTDMMELAGIISNKRGMAMTEVSDRIRSAMNQEADGAMELGVDVRIAAIKAGNAYKEMGNNMPWDKMSEGMRKTILYHHIFEQVAKNLGNTMQDNTAMRMSAFVATLADVRLALGQAFLPIMYSVLPLLTKMAQALYNVLVVIGAFMRSLFGGGFKFKAPVGAQDVKNTQAQASAMDDVGDASEKAGKKSAKAGKKAKEAWSGTFGFDEVNTVDDPKDSDAGAGAGGGGGGGGGGLGGLEAPKLPPNPFVPFEEALDKLAGKMKKYTDPIKNAFKEAWSAISTFAKEKFGEVAKWWDENGAKIIEGIKIVWGIVGPIFSWLVSFIWESIKGLISGVIRFFQGLIEFFTGVFTGDWGMAWQGIKDMFFGIIQAIWNFTNLTLVGGLKKLFLTLVKDGLAIFLTFGKSAMNLFKMTWEDIIKTFLNLIKNIKQFFKDFGTWFEAHAVSIAHKVIGAFEAIGKVGKTIWNAIKNAFVGAVDWFSRSVITPISNKFEAIKDAFHEGIGAGFRALLNSVRAPLNDMIGALNGVKNALPLIKHLPNIPKIPHLAQGGITNGPTLAMVGDNRGGREVISPLDRLQSMLTNSVIQAMQMSGGLGNRNSGDIILNLDGRAFARIVKPFLNQEENRVGTDIRIRTI